MKGRLECICSRPGLPTNDQSVTVRGQERQYHIPRSRYSLAVKRYYCELDAFNHRTPESPHFLPVKCPWGALAPVVFQVIVSPVKAWKRPVQDSFHARPWGAFRHGHMTISPHGAAWYTTCLSCSQDATKGCHPISSTSRKIIPARETVAGDATARSSTWEGGSVAEGRRYAPFHVDRLVPLGNTVCLGGEIQTIRQTDFH